MSDIMRPMPFGQLMDWALGEYRRRWTAFGVSATEGYWGTRPLLGGRVEVPLGPAAGPHTQLAQNIVAAYTAGARFFELKTVQVMDGEDLRRCVPKPCITAADEGYNCEWSTELTVPQAFEEYVKAWFACHLLSRELYLSSKGQRDGDPPPGGFVFNMSVGYDLAGIQSPKIDRFLTDMMDAGDTEIFRSCKAWTLAHLDRFKRIDAAFVEGIPAEISRSITESTLHGCPPAEIEGIASYLIREKGLHTYVKCNPTLLGYDFARKTLDDLGYDYIAFDDHHFREDLQWADAVPMFRRLMKLAAEKGVEFGVKLTNTFPVDVKHGELPSGEMYMSGRALFPLSVSLAAKLSREFDGQLPISYSGGADLHSVEELAEAGISPITVATTLLKPGGYRRLEQLGKACEERILYRPLLPEGRVVHPEAVAALAARAMGDPYYRKDTRPQADLKLHRPVPLLDCFTAPCRGNCPIGQDIPAFIRWHLMNLDEIALEIILERNPLPFITGTLCPHPCTGKCTRTHYEGPVHIRDAKLASAEGGYKRLYPRLYPNCRREGGKAAVVGGGPAGMAAAFFLARYGVPVTLYEASGELGGVVRHLIPSFRISDEAIDKDVSFLHAMKVDIRLNSPVNSYQDLEGQGYTHVVFATGAQKHGVLPLEYGQSVNFTEVLSALRRGETPDLGPEVAVVGGGNSAMDTARAVRRLPGVKNVRLVYRRTVREMPAQAEELAEARGEGVELLELLSPAGVADGVLTCRVMIPGAPGPDGRRSVADTGNTVTLPCTTLIAAVGERVDEKPDPGPWPVIGDRKNGPGTVVEAIRDAMDAARSILESLDRQGFGPIRDYEYRWDYFERFTDENRDGNRQAHEDEKGKLFQDCSACTPGRRCLECGTICGICADVCPNRANAVVDVPGLALPQIVHVDALCNECGNCAVFCPYDSAPYKDKLTLFWRREDFDDSANQGWLPLDRNRILLRLDGAVQEVDLSAADGGGGPAAGGVSGAGLTGRQAVLAVIRAVRDSYPWMLGET